MVSYCLILSITGLLKEVFFMACLLVPAAEAVVTTVVQKAIEKKEKAAAENGNPAENKPETSSMVPFSQKLKWLNSMLWGGAALLAFEHIWHGEIVPWFPFLTAASNPEDTAEMLHEMSTVGVTMAILVTVIWGIMVGVSSLIENRAKKLA